MNNFHSFNYTVLGMFVFFVILVISITNSTNVYASDVVLLNCGIRGPGFKVTGYEASKNPNASNEVNGANCAETVEQLIANRYTIQTNSSNANGLNVFSFLGVGPALKPGELRTLTQAGTSSCSCEDAIPITGMNCVSCTIHIPPGGGLDDGNCECSFTFSTPSN